MSERWIYFNDVIEISNHGRVRKCIDMSDLQAIVYRYDLTTLDRQGYKRFTADRKSIYLHHAVAKLFIGDRPEGKVIDHIDRDKTNNHVDNLRYCTYSENSRNTDRYDNRAPIEFRAKRSRMISYRSCLKRRFKTVTPVKYPETLEYTIFECSNCDDYKTYIIKIDGDRKWVNKEFSSLASAMSYVSCF